MAQVAHNKTETEANWAGEMLKQINDKVKEFEYLPHRLTPAVSYLRSLIKAKKINILNYFATVEGDDLLVLFILNDNDKITKTELSHVLAELYFKYEDENFAFEFLIFEQSDCVTPPDKFIELSKDNA